MILTDEQRAKRRGLICSSDVAAIVGVSPYHAHDAQAVWNEKMGIARDELGDADNDAFWFGHQVEPLIARRYTEKTGHRLVPGGTFESPKFPWAGATVDFTDLSDASPVECKLVGVNMLRGWDESKDDGIPHDKMVQAQWQMLVRGASTMRLAALIGGTRFRIFEIAANEGLQADLVMHAERFYREHVIKGDPPPLTGSDSVRDYLNATYPRHDVELIEADEEIEALMLHRVACANAEKTAGLGKKEADHKLMAKLAEHCGFVSHERGLKYTWKANKNGTRVPRMTVRGGDDE